jgi:hypothetical protein
MRHLATAILIFLAVLVLASIPKSHARDNGQYANSPLREWFRNLTDQRGFGCCAMSDGSAVEDPDWESSNGHYRVRVDGVWFDVPDEAVITEPNRAKRTMVWMIQIYNGPLEVRCFLPGEMS